MRHPQIALGLTLLWLSGTLAACNSSDFASAGKKSKGGGAASSKDADATDGGDLEVDPDVSPNTGEQVVDPQLGYPTDSSGMILSPSLDSGDNAAGDVGSDSDVASFVPRFGLLVNDLRCSFCHLKINGDVASTSDVNGLWPHSVGEVSGAWNAAKSVDFTRADPAWPPVGTFVSMLVAGGINQNQKGDDLPNDLDKDGSPDFPTLDFNAIASAMRGQVTAKGVDIRKVHEGNLVIIGTDQDPITISGEVLIKGDLVIKGIYKGIGNFYATGNIYVPANLRALNSPFPFSADVKAALEQAKAAVAAKKDALGLASDKSVFIADIDDHGVNNSSVFAHAATPTGMHANELGVYDVYNWIPGGKAGYDALYEPATVSCPSPDHRAFPGAVELLEAFVYARKAVAGRSNFSSYSINGGVIADHFHIISGAIACPVGIHPLHKQDQKSSYVNYDYRMRTGLLLLKQFFPFFKKN